MSLHVEVAVLNKISHLVARRTSVQEMLSEIGYDTTDELSALTAFQRHFYPESLLELADRTIERLAAVWTLYSQKDPSNEPL